MNFISSRVYCNDERKCFSLIQVTPMNDRTPLILGRQRAVASTSLDPYEDPFAGLERVSLSPRVSSLSRRRREIRRRVEERSEREEKREHALSSTYESLNYEISENQLYRDEEGDPDHHRSSPVVCSIAVLFYAVTVIRKVCGCESVWIMTFFS
ncbi:hypothetical protein KIN20_019448 [Parelaphostrongylus tenuis]|uniref:Uncharacterized protein n=1 Tax=Parelaphostrongylus tenuis TaxID=148309 RepID=A0AAD5ML35_PARTN|nr:hypothetical protein KIN20_019448 [Parelaphostrongylus tenuis]